MQGIEQPSGDRPSGEIDRGQLNAPDPESLQAPNLQIQQPVNVSRLPSMLDPPEIRFDFDQSSVNRVREAKNVEALTVILLPTVEKKITEPRFNALNQAWRTKILPKMERRANTIRNNLAAAERTDTSENAPWQPIRKALENTIQSAENMHFVPPAERYWWISVRGKGEALDSLHINRQYLNSSSVGGFIGIYVQRRRRRCR